MIARAVVLFGFGHLPHAYPSTQAAEEMEKKAETSELSCH
jgi:hypothetical protein